MFWFNIKKQTNPRDQWSSVQNPQVQKKQEKNIHVKFYPPQRRKLKIMPLPLQSLDNLKNDQSINVSETRNTGKTEIHNMKSWPSKFIRRQVSSYRNWIFTFLFSTRFKTSERRSSHDSSSPKEVNFCGSGSNTLHIYTAKDLEIHAMLPKVQYND